MARVRARKRGGLGRTIGWVVKGIFLFILLSLLWVLLYRFVNPPFTFTMLGDRIGGRQVSSDWMSLERIDRDAVRAAIAAEDSKFCSHWGFDQDAIAAAMRRNARGGSVIRGGSTISQQTAKNAFLWQGGGYPRKALEAWFTLLIENMWGKRRIMEVYLNIAETGIGTYGVNAGAKRYFNHDASAMSRVEAARIAAVLPLAQEARSDGAQGLHPALRQRHRGADRRRGARRARSLRLRGRDRGARARTGDSGSAQAGGEGEGRSAPAARRPARRGI